MLRPPSLAEMRETAGVLDSSSLTPVVAGVGSCFEIQLCTSLPNSARQAGSLKPAVLGIFAPQDLADATDQGFSFGGGGVSVVSHLADPAVPSPV